MKPAWRDGNRIELLENGEEFFPAVFAAIDEAKDKVFLETFIWFEDKVGKELHRAILGAARRGVSVEVLLDGYGSPDLSDDFVNQLTSAGVKFRYYDPRPPLMGMRTNVFRRMHRKIVVIDGELAFVGGINYSAEHVSDYGPEAKQDYAVRVQGPVVQDIYAFVLQNLPGHEEMRRWWGRRRHQAQDNNAPGEAQALFVWRDNDDHRDDIERYYLKMLANAKQEVIIANAYFFPGRRFRAALARAAARGVRVTLLLQGRVEYALVHYASRALYDELLAAGMVIQEYHHSLLHAKVAVFDGVKSCVGSSNIEPFSLLLAREANVFVDDASFSGALRASLLEAIERGAQPVPPQRWRRQSLPARARIWVAFQLARLFIAFAGIERYH